MNITTAKQFETEVFKLQNALGNKKLFASVAMFRQANMVVKSRQTGQPNPHSVIYKLSWGTIGVNYEYGQSVNEQRKREGKTADFVALKPNGRHHVTNLILESDKVEGQYYLQIALNTANPMRTAYFDKDGNRLNAQAIQQYLQTSEFTHSVGSRQGTQKPVRINTPKFETIARLSLGKFHYNKLKKLPVKVKI